MTIYFKVSSELLSGITASIPLVNEKGRAYGGALIIDRSLIDELNEIVRKFPKGSTLILEVRDPRKYGFRFQIHQVTISDQVLKLPFSLEHDVIQSQHGYHTQDEALLDRGIEA